MIQRSGGKCRRVNRLMQNYYRVFVGRSELSGVKHDFWAKTAAQPVPSTHSSRAVKSQDQSQREGRHEQRVKEAIRETNQEKFSNKHQIAELGI